VDRLPVGCRLTQLWLSPFAQEILFFAVFVGFPVFACDNVCVGRCECFLLNPDVTLGRVSVMLLNMVLRFLGHSLKSLSLVQKQAFFWQS